MQAGGCSCIPLHTLQAYHAGVFKLNIMETDTCSVIRAERVRCTQEVVAVTLCTYCRPMILG